MKTGKQKNIKPKPQLTLTPGHPVMLNEYNYKSMVKLAQELNCTVDEALNTALGSVIFEAVDRKSKSQ